MRSLTSAAAAALLAVGCGSASNGRTAAAAPACTAAAATATDQITIAASRFQPACAKVTAGTTVTFTNADAMAHTVTADAGQSETFDAPVGIGAQFQHAFATPGTVGYHCTLHLGMAGAIVVE
jgi:plastocyanin